MTREEAIEHIKTVTKYAIYDGYDSAVVDALEMAIKALEQESCEDEYIKVPKKALKYRTAGMVAYNAEWLKDHFDIERAVICGAQEPCEDAISRQAILDVIEREQFKGDAISEIEKLSPVIPQPKTGHWITISSIDMCCSECNEIEDLNTSRKFCAYCGAKMIEPQESEVNV